MLAAGALYIRMHCGAEVTESSTNKQHHLSMYAHMCVCVRVFGNESVCGTMFNACRWAAFRKRSASPAPGVPPSTTSTVRGLPTVRYRPPWWGSRSRSAVPGPPGARFALAWAGRPSELDSAPPPAAVCPVCSLCALAAPWSPGASRSSNLEAFCEGLMGSIFYYEFGLYDQVPIILEIKGQTRAVHRLALNSKFLVNERSRENR